MATKLQTDTQEPELLNIEELRRKHKISPAVFAGTCAANGWRPGKKVSEADFIAAANKFTGALMNGKTAEVKR